VRLRIEFSDFQFLSLQQNSQLAPPKKGETKDAAMTKEIQNLSNL